MWYRAIHTNTHTYCPTPAHTKALHLQTHVHIHVHPHLAQPTHLQALDLQDGQGPVRVGVLLGHCHLKLAIGLRSLSRPVAEALVLWAVNNTANVLFAYFEDQHHKQIMSNDYYIYHASVNFQVSLSYHGNLHAFILYSVVMATWLHFICSSKQHLCVRCWFPLPCIWVSLNNIIHTRAHVDAHTHAHMQLGVYITC